jgi:hypothetical protein
VDAVLGLLESSFELRKSAPSVEQQRDLVVAGVECAVLESPPRQQAVEAGPSFGHGCPAALGKMPLAIAVFSELSLDS